MAPHPRRRFAWGGAALPAGFGDIVPCWYYYLVLCYVVLLVGLSVYPGLTAAAAIAILGVMGLGWFWSWFGLA